MSVFEPGIHPIHSKCVATVMLIATHQNIQRSLLSESIKKTWIVGEKNHVNLLLKSLQTTTIVVDRFRLASVTLGTVYSMFR
jgi:hypothetical protein